MLYADPCFCSQYFVPHFKYLVYSFVIKANFFESGAAQGQDSWRNESNPIETIIRAEAEIEINFAEKSHRGSARARDRCR